MDQTFELEDVTATDPAVRIAALVAQGRSQLTRITSLRTKPTEEEKQLTALLVGTADDLVEAMEEQVAAGDHRRAKAAAAGWQQQHAANIRRAQRLTESGRQTMTPVVLLAQIIAAVAAA